MTFDEEPDWYLDHIYNASNPMIETTHTPGPWKNEHTSLPRSAQYGGCITGKDGDVICWVQYEKDEPFIAAAPEMFSLLHRIVKEQCGICSFQYGMNANCETCLYGEARTLIAKAKGEPNP